jgi:cell wall-associated NlpC family hydrolase
MLPSWVEKYIGLPFEERGRSSSGCDCWGLVRLILREEMGIEVADFSEHYQSTGEFKRVKFLIEKEAQQWKQIGADEVRLADLVLLRFREYPLHIGMALEPGLMIHTERGKEAVIERYDQLKWINKIVGFYRHDITSSSTS